MNATTSAILMLASLVGSVAHAGDDNNGNSFGNLDSIDEGLVAYYPLDGDAEDATQNRNDGTICGAMYTDGHSGPGSVALEFDGVDDYVDITTAMEQVGQLGRGTISLWYRLDNAPNQVANRPNPATGFAGVPQDKQITYPALWMGGVDPVAGNNSLMVHPIHPNQAATSWFTIVKNMLPADPTIGRAAGRPLFCFDSCDVTKSNCDGTVQPDVLTAGQWYHYVVVVDDQAADGSVRNRGYLNGVELVNRRFNPGRSGALLNAPKGPGVPSESDDREFFDDVAVQDEFLLGAGHWAYSQTRSFFDGAIDEVRIYDRVLSADEVLELYQAEDWAKADIKPWQFDNSCDLPEEKGHDSRWEDGWGAWWDEHKDTDQGQSEEWWDLHWW